MSSDADGITRRDFMVAGGSALAAGSLPGVADAAEELPGTVHIALEINGRAHQLDIEPRATLLDTLREQLGLCGTKKGCDHGQCGACTVHIDDRRVVSCLTLTVQAQGRKVTTIEGIASGERLHAMQQAFLDHDALQCGYCTPGQIMSAIACVKEGHTGSADEIQEYMSGNLCRCGAYVGILAAIQDVAARHGDT